MKKSIFLEDKTTGKICEFPADSISRFIGRGEDCYLSTFADYDWISRKQVEIIHKKHGDIILIQISDKCNTYFEGEKVETGTSIKIHAGTIIRFSYDYFISVLGYNDERIKLLRKARLEDTIEMKSSFHPQNH